MNKTTSYLHEIGANVAANGYTVPAQRLASKKIYSFSKLDLAEQWPIWDAAWRSREFWIMLQAYFFCEKLVKKGDALVAAWPLLKSWQREVDDWTTSDCLSKLYARVLELKPELIYPVLEEWNSSDNSWERRQSLVSLLYYSSTRISLLPFKKCIGLVKNLLKDEEYYVQKGVGWTLRELGNVYPEETQQFLEENIREISAIAFSAATEKMDKKEKEVLKGMRKKK